ncbi:hypothetical protein TPB0596_31140 [Tsukamurella pulmonis]|uniref:hypothetical protein n=1 Tax=Tsukamurella pulmonis TaxID=47312 RepID=UPI001EDF2736|nr:hypothetical protein [Tsukamurella pulmonis]BDD83351.1 hypothetical protein TPB0596_31140 [Tsukamurella pulmonis]
MDNAILRINAAALVGIAVLGLGIAAWNTAHELTFALLVLAGCVLLACERVAVAIKGRGRE